MKKTIAVIFAFILFLIVGNCASGGIKASDIAKLR